MDPGLRSLAYEANCAIVHAFGAAGLVTVASIQAQIMHRPTQSEMAARGVLDLAREVRIHLDDARIIFGTIVSVANRDARHFMIRPWGLRLPMTITYDKVTHAVPVKLMVWKKQRDISAAQRTGDFSGATSKPATSSLPTVGPLALETSVATSTANDNQIPAEDPLSQIPAEEPIPNDR